MSVAYEPRNFIHEGAYPPIGDEHDHGVEQRFTDSDVAELSHYTTEAALLPDDRGVMEDESGVLGDDRGVLGDDRGVLGDDHSVMGDEQAMMGQDAVAVQDATRMDLTHSSFPSPLPDALQAPHMGDPLAHDDKDLSSGVGSPPTTTPRVKPIPKPDREAVKGADGKYHCPNEDCKEDIRAFTRKCEWNKHMDKHERPYRCPAEGCENLPGFTYSGGLLRHEREVHGKHGGPKNTVNCPHPNCKRHTGKGFSRQENLNEHLRRVHTNLEGSAGISPPAEGAVSPGDNDGDKTGTKRKRPSSGQTPDELTGLREEVKRVREENKKLKADMEQQSQHSLGMMAQIAELQDALRHGLGAHGLGAPTAQMI